MKNIKYLLLVLMSITLITSCKEDDYDMSPGNPVLEVKTPFANAYFGDNIQFTAVVSDNVPLSTLTVKLFYGDKEVAKTVIRTKENGEYSGTIVAPFFKDIPDATATLEFTLMDTHLTSVTKPYDLPLSRPKFPYLILVTPSATYPMLPTEVPYEYAATEAFPNIELPAYIKAPVISENGNELTFGWDDGEVTQGVITDIPFMSPRAGVFSVFFNTKTFKAGPFFEIDVNGELMSMVDKENFRVDINVGKNDTLKIKGIDDISDWWADPDFITRTSENDNEFIFLPITGKYRIIANTKHKYFRFEVMIGSALATLQDDGTGAIWVIGDSFGKPHWQQNYVGWNTDNAVCTAPIGDLKYRLTLVAGETLRPDFLNFKFFHQRGWGGEFLATTLSTNSDLVKIGDGSGGSNNDNGNIYLKEGVALEEGATYEFIIEVSAGKNGILTITKK